jgi:hypothetical protein
VKETDLDFFESTMNGDRKKDETSSRCIRATKYASNGIRVQ